MYRLIVILSLAFTVPFSSLAQGELNCLINIDSESAGTIDKRIFEDMRTNLTTFMNRRWTNDEYLPEERITCNIFITITNIVSQTGFEATALIQSSRPIYNTNKETILLKFLDRKFNFEYTEGQPLFFAENTHTDNLTSMLAYYAYMILAMDYDSFSKLGGTEYYEKARNVVLVAQPMAGGAWTPGESPNNRYWLSDNMNSQILTPFREGLYNYHRLGLDKFLVDAEESRKEILEVLQNIRKVTIQNPAAVAIKNFFNVKVDELVNIFTQASFEQKQQAVKLLREIDPLNSEKYQKLLKI